MMSVAGGQNFLLIRSECMEKIPFIQTQWNHYHPFRLHTESRPIIVKPRTELPSRRSQTRIVCDLPVATCSTGASSKPLATCSTGASSKPLTVSRGLDFLKVSFWLEWKTDQFFDVLDKAKKQAQSYDLDSVPVFKERGFDWNLHRTGTSKYTFRLTSGDVTLMFNRRKAEGAIPTCRMEIGSLSCWTPGFHSIYDQVKVFFNWYGAKIVKERVSEVHLASDFIGSDIKTLNIDNQDRWIAKSTGFNSRHEILTCNDSKKSKDDSIDFSSRFTHRKFTSLTIGSRSGMVLNIYDKVTELKTTHSAHKQEIFAEIWGLTKFNDQPVTRVEYRIRRSNLREFSDIEKKRKIDTVEDLIISLKSLWQYLTSSWTKHTQKDVDRNHHQSRAKVSEFWEKVRSVVWTGVFGLIRNRPVIHRDIVMLRKQAVGILMSVCACFDVKSDDIDKIIYLCQDFIERDLYQLFEDQTAFIKKMKIKRNAANNTLAG
jgi:hypothetical protein